ncbi:hypothetical protein O3P69_004128 [Scylla paramamosain]|uniref:Uncharacterized protein n=1 Tax=Scylla paramamosain TaxID=85552 RepID=A0AAW0UF86_SCYPA
MCRGSSTHTSQDLLERAGDRNSAPRPVIRSSRSSPEHSGVPRRFGLRAAMSLVITVIISLCSQCRAREVLECQEGRTLPYTAILHT